MQGGKTKLVTKSASVTPDLAAWLSARAARNRRSERAEIAVILEGVAAQEAAQLEGAAA